MMLVEAAPPAETWPEVWLLDAEEPLVEEDDPVAIDEESALPGVLEDKLEPVGEALLDALLTVLLWFVKVDDELLLATVESCVPWVVEEFAVEEGLRVVTELAAAVFLPDVEAAAAAPVVVADPWM